MSFNPSHSWALQVSHGFLKSPEELHPNEDIFRTTASATFSKELSRNTNLNAIALWGLNKRKDHEGENAFLFEASLHRNKLVLHGRYEFIQKSAEELTLDETFGEAVFPAGVGPLTVPSVSSCTAD